MIRALGLLAAASLLLAEGCGGDGAASWAATGAGAGSATSGGGGAAGGQPEGCIDIHVDTTGLPDPASWSPLTGLLPRHPFWRTATGLHVAWTALDTSYMPHLVVSSFDAATGATLAQRIYDVFPASVAQTTSWNIYDAAGSPDGQFAVIVSFKNQPGDVYVTQYNVFGSLDDATHFDLWPLPYTEAETVAFNAGWDGEAFAILDAPPGGDLRVTRVTWDGSAVTTLLPPTPVGTSTSVFEDEVDIQTDPVSGTTWIVSQANGGAWLSGHLRDGTPLPGTEKDGGVLIRAKNLHAKYPQSSNFVAVAPDGDRAMLAWLDVSNYDHTSLQEIALGATSVDRPADGIVIDDTQESYHARKALMRVGKRSCLAAVNDGPSGGIDQFWIEDNGDVSRALLIDTSRLKDGVGDGFRNLMGNADADAAYLGFQDGTDLELEPYRVLATKAGCVYPSAGETKPGR